jgi:HPt (histidine-containing phosphotransfer) domain-containing protein
MTADVMAEDRDRCLDAGMDGFIPKPVRPEALFTILAETAQQPASPLVEQSSSAEAVDDSVLDELGRSLGGDRAAMDEILASYLSSAPELVDSMLSAATQGDSRLLAFQAHALRSASAWVGATRLSQLCAELERLGNAEVHEGTVDRAEAAVVEFGRVRAALIARRAAV